MSTRPTTRRSARAYAILTSVALLVGALTVSQASAAPKFHASGSVNQVYVTGAAAGAQMSLLNPAGKAIKTQRANSLGGVLFRDVPAASGYRVRRAADGLKSPALTVHSDTAAPWN